MAIITLEAKDVRACLARSPLRLIVDVGDEKFWNRSDSHNGDMVCLKDQSLPLAGIIFVIIRRFPDVPYKPTIGSPYLVEVVIGNATLRGHAIAFQYLEENHVDLRVSAKDES